MPEESGGERSEQPTARRQQEARDAGNIARSPDLVAAALLLGILMLLKSFGPPIVAAMKMVVEETLNAKSLGNLSPGSALEDMARALTAVGIAMAPLFLGVVLIAALANMVQVGFVFNPNRLAPNFGALNPFRGLGRIFGGRRSAMRLVMALVKVFFVGMTAYSAVHGRLGQIVMSQRLSFVQIFGLGAQLVYAIALRIGILLLVLAILDYIYQRRMLQRDLMMTKEEVKDEMRRMDGDPKIKARRREIAVKRHLKRLKKEVPKADVVVTNPTHFAVALKYESATMRAPRVIAKGQDIMAQRIKEIAIEFGIPLVERPPLARALYRMCTVGDEIPEQFYSAVAEILAYVYQLAKRARKMAG
jgi:flagellar biosynthesis protein FlhB